MTDVQQGPRVIGDLDVSDPGADELDAFILAVLTEDEAMVERLIEQSPAAGGLLVAGLGALLGAIDIVLDGPDAQRRWVRGVRRDAKRKRRG